MTKILPQNPFSFEEGESSTLDISTKIEFIEYRSSVGYQHNPQMVPGLNINRISGGHRFGSVSHDGI
jgi:hypothetical protein